MGNFLIIIFCYTRQSRMALCNVLKFVRLLSFKSFINSVIVSVNCSKLIDVGLLLPVSASAIICPRQVEIVAIVFVPPPSIAKTYKYLHLYTILIVETISPTSTPASLRTNEGDNVLIRSIVS